MNTKLCRQCGIEKELSSFYVNKRAPDGLFAICRTCHRARDTEWKKNNPDRAREIQKKYHHENREILEVKRRQKITANFIAYSQRRKELALLKKNNRYGTLIEDLLVNQDNKCSICKMDFNGNVFDIDHDHETQFIRGLLCRKCNSGLHYFEDSIFIKKAKSYLAHTPASKFPPRKY